MILYGDKGESGKIYLTPSDGTTFEPGKQYRVSVNIKDIGKVFEIFMFPYDLQWPMCDILIKHGGPCLTTFPFTEKRIRSQVFFTNFEVFGNVVDKLLVSHSPANAAQYVLKFVTIFLVSNITAFVLIAHTDQQSLSRQ